jgi:transcriptional regulator with XRE-family HTH domain
MSDRLKAMLAEGAKHEGFAQGYAERKALARVGERLRAARAAAGLSQSQLAARTGLTQSAISRLESGTTDRSPELRTVIRYLSGCEFELELGWRRPEGAAAAATRAAARTSALHYTTGATRPRGLKHVGMAQAVHVAKAAHAGKPARAMKAIKARVG